MTIDELKKDLHKKLQAVKEVMDADITDVDIESQKNKLLKLTQLGSLAAACKAQGKQILRLRELEALRELVDKGYSPSVLTKMIDARCCDEEALYIYTDRMNAFLSHSIEGIRSVISLYKEEMRNNLTN